MLLYAVEVWDFTFTVKVEIFSNSKFCIYCVFVICVVEENVEIN